MVVWRVYDQRGRRTTWVDGLKAVLMHRGGLDEGGGAVSWLAQGAVMWH